MIRNNKQTADTNGAAAPALWSMKCAKKYIRFEIESELDATFAKAFNRVDFCHFALPTLELELSKRKGFYELCAHAEVPERDTGEPNIVIVYTTLKPERAAKFHESARHLVRRLMLHEVDEAYHIDGVRVKDPHRGDEP